MQNLQSAICETPGCTDSYRNDWISPTKSLQRICKCDLQNFIRVAHVIYPPFVSHRRKMKKKKKVIRTTWGWVFLSDLCFQKCVIYDMHKNTLNIQSNCDILYCRFTWTINPVLLFSQNQFCLPTRDTSLCQSIALWQWRANRFGQGLCVCVWCIVQKVLLTLKATHSSPWRAVSSPPWTCCFYFPLQSFYTTQKGPFNTTA